MCSDVEMQDYLFQHEQDGMLGFDLPHVDDDIGNADPLLLAPSGAGCGQTPGAVYNVLTQLQAAPLGSLAIEQAATCAQQAHLAAAAAPYISAATASMTSMLNIPNLHTYALSSSTPAGAAETAAGACANGESGSASDALSDAECSPVVAARR
eukprot:XP_001689419.1 predicted protein [Chlamydomonas reinhardtii]